MFGFFAPLRIAHLNSTPFSTKERILGAAEELFARNGFAGASLRELTASAKVNLAAVNYHFGSKDNLINEVFRRRLDELSTHRLEALQAARDKAKPTLEDILAAFIHPSSRLPSAPNCPIWTRKSCIGASTSLPAP